ncbi:uncharacterized protein EAF01_006979 [Botrytis porri]|nr:uncharacterized protein EAF01_006979 [Botrytis porri]KAF7901680.1 hypothetical protein EAF01_006979 [Botrytis porri]
MTEAAEKPSTLCKVCDVPRYLQVSISGWHVPWRSWSIDILPGYHCGPGRAQIAKGVTIPRPPRSAMFLGTLRPPPRCGNSATISKSPGDGSSWSIEILPNITVDQDEPKSPKG